MPRLNIIVLDKPDADSYRVALWMDVPAARQPFYANPNAKSAWKDALAGDNALLQSGAVVEIVTVQRVTQGAPLATAQAAVITLWNNTQAAINAANPWVRYGTTWDGTNWVAGGVV